MFTSAYLFIGRAFLKTLEDFSSPKLVLKVQSLSSGDEVLRLQTRFSFRQLSILLLSIQNKRKRIFVCKHSAYSRDRTFEKRTPGPGCLSIIS